MIKTGSGFLDLAGHTNGYSFLMTSEQMKDESGSTRRLKMRNNTHVAVLLVLTGCATFRTAPVRTFEDSVRASLEYLQDGGTCVVIAMNKDGNITIDERPTTLDELSTMNRIQGIPAHPAEVLLRVEGEVSFTNEYIRACCHALCKGGVKQIAFLGPKKKACPKQAVMRTDAPQTDHRKNAVAPASQIMACVAAVSECAVSVVGLANKKYMVVDLSRGANAVNYPISYRGYAPLGGWTDDHKTTKLVLRRVNAGTFSMGRRATDYPGDVDIGLHDVTLSKDFYIGVFEVTQRQWELVMGDKPSYFNNAMYYAVRPVEQVSYYDIRENPANNDDASVDWPRNTAVNAASFMGRLRAKTGLETFDLPTEAQWEYACRAGTTTALSTGKNLTNPWGNRPDPQMDEVGRYYNNGGSRESQNCATTAGTAAVGSYLPNSWGLYDMHGNVYEWCLDWFAAFPTNAVNDPVGAASGSDRVPRGGFFFSCSSDCRAASRTNYSPDLRFRSIGLRVATLPATQ